MANLYLNFIISGEILSVAQVRVLACKAGRDILTSSHEENRRPSQDAITRARSLCDVCLRTFGIPTVLVFVTCFKMKANKIARICIVFD